MACSVLLRVRNRAKCWSNRISSKRSTTPAPTRNNPLLQTVFFGTPHFAVPTLDALVANGLAPRVVVCQPDRPVGRGRRLVQPPVAEAAVRHGLPLAQPETVRDPAFMSLLESHAPDVAVVVAFGQIFRAPLLALPRLGCINLHASLLPRWRGAAPIQAAIAHGDPETGVTTMRMNTGLDSGPMLLQETLTVGARETCPELAERLAAVGAELMVRTLRALEAETVVPREQPEQGVTLAPRLTKADGIVDWRQPAVVIDRAWRGYQPWPGLTATLDEQPLKLLAVEPVSHAEAASGSDVDVPAPHPSEPGTVLGLDHEGVRVACGNGSTLRLLRVQRPGRAGTTASAWFHGERRQAGDRFAVPEEAAPVGGGE